MNNKFSALDLIVHIATGKKYIVLEVPDNCVKIEATGKPCYYYEERSTKLGWIRPKDEMEDGRFKRSEK